MALTEREQQVYDEICKWEYNLAAYEANDLQLTYDRYLEYSFSLLPNKIKHTFSASLDQWLFHLHAMIQGTQLQQDARKRIFDSGRIFNREIETVEDMSSLSIDQLSYIAEQQIARHRLYSFAQGGMSGTGGFALFGADLPGMLVINMRIVQLIAVTYGVEVNTPYEMMTALKVFNAGVSPTRVQYQHWEELMREAEENERYFYEGNEEVVDITWIEPLLKQALKGTAILTFRKKNIQGIPIISMFIGAASNYQVTRKVTEFAHNYYQMRYLLNKKGNHHEY